MEKNVFILQGELTEAYKAARDSIRAAAGADNSTPIYNATGDCLRMLEWADAGTIAKHCNIANDKEATIECICRHAAKLCGFHAAAVELWNLRRYFPDLASGIVYDGLLELSSNAFRAALAARVALYRFILDKYIYFCDDDLTRLYDTISELIDRGIYA